MHNADNNVIDTHPTPLQFHIPITFKRSGHRTQTTSPNQPATRKTALTPMQKALIRGHRWLDALETGQAKNLQDLAQQANVDPRYVNRMLNLTTLAPDIVADILDNKLPDHATISALTTNTPRLWAEQRKTLDANSACFKI